LPHTAIGRFAATTVLSFGLLIASVKSSNQLQQITTDGLRAGNKAKPSLLYFLNFPFVPGISGRHFTKIFLIKSSNKK
jgi:hypothetical protein